MTMQAGIVIETLIGATAHAAIDPQPPACRFHRLCMLAGRISREPPAEDRSPKTFHDDTVKEGELEAWQNRLEFHGIPKYPPTDWQPRDPRHLMLPEERAAHDRAQAAKTPTP